MSEDQVFAELKGNRIEVKWQNVSRQSFAKFVDGIRSVPGRRFQRESRTWTVPKDLDTARMLRTAFGSHLVIGPNLREWANAEVSVERNLGSLASADTARLTRLPERLPELYEAIHCGPRGRDMTPKQRKKCVKKEDPSFQAADVAFLSQSPAPLNLNHMGLGKTIEAIASVFESGTENGPQLVIAPLSTVETVWAEELRRWQDLPVLFASGRKERSEVLDEAWKMARKKKAFWLVVNPAMVQYRKDETNESDDYIHPAKPREERLACHCSVSRNPHWHYRSVYPALHRIQWANVIIDEAHRAALGNTKSITYNALVRLQADRRMLQTGTPMGGKPLNLFGMLSFLRPDVFTSKWNWAGKWLEIDDTGFAKKITNTIREDRKEEFYRSLIPYALRRTKEEALPWLPPKQYVSLWVDMTESQEKQYQQFAEDAEVTIEENRLVGKAVLDEYTRLRQFAIARMTMKKGKLTPTADSGKVEALEQILTELGILGDEAGEEQCVVFSQFTEVVDMIVDHLSSKGVGVASITGKVKASDRSLLQKQFQDGKLQVMVMNVKAGGVGINLDRANTVVFMDETWNPDDQEQAEDRCHRASRIHQVTIYYIRSKGTIEEYVYDEVTAKQATNIDILDVRRRMNG